MRKVSTLLCVAMVLYAIPAFGERITPKARSVDRTTLTIQNTDSVSKTPISEGRTATVVGVAYSNMAFDAAYAPLPYCAGGCIWDDYDSVVDKPFVQGTFSFVGGVSQLGVMWITFFDTVGSFVTSGGWYFPTGLYIWNMDFLGAPAADAGIVQFYPDPGYVSATTGSVFYDMGGGPEIGTAVPGIMSNPEVADGQLMVELNSVVVGICCIPLTGDCQGPMDEGSCGGVFDPTVLTCDPNPCPPGTCGNGVIDPPDEECDDGNTEPGDGCNAICQIEETFIPAVSEWGLLVMALLGLTVGTVLFGRRRAMA